MTKLSSSAQVVLQAIAEISPAPANEIAAAALLAAAKHIKARVRDSAPPTDWGQGWVEGVKNAACGLGAIADELEGQGQLTKESDYD